MACLVEEEAGGLPRSIWTVRIDVPRGGYLDAPTRSAVVKLVALFPLGQLFAIGLAAPARRNTSVMEIYAQKMLGTSCRREELAVRLSEELSAIGQHSATLVLTLH